MVKTIKSALSIGTYSTGTMEIKTKDLRRIEGEINEIMVKSKLDP